MANSLTDLAGGVTSLAQQGLDAWLFRDASLLTGDPAKLALACLSMAYCGVLLAQHYVHFAEPAGEGGGGDAEAAQRLLDGREDDDDVLAAAA